MAHSCSALTARLCIGLAILSFGLCVGMDRARAQNATWEGPGTDWSVDSNWSSDIEPAGVATFTNNGAPTSVANSQVVTIEEINFTALAPAYTFTNTSQFIIAGPGIVNNSGHVQTFVNNLLMHLFDGTAGNAAITNNSTLEFDNSSAGNATITNNNFLEFNNSSTAGSATITNNDLLIFDDSSAGSATIINNDSGSIDFDGSSTAGSATITNNDGGNIGFFNTSSAGNASITNNNGGEIDFRSSSNAGSAAITNDDSLEFRDTSNAGNATITNNEILQFFDSSNAGSATIINDLVLIFSNSSNAGNATITNNEIIEFFGFTSAGSATIINNEGVTFRGNSTGEQARFITNANAATDFSDSFGPTGTRQLSAGSLAGAGNYFLGANQLTVGGNNLSSEVSGVISDCGPTGSGCVDTGAAGGSLIKVGTGTFTLSGNNIYTGPTAVNAGTLVVNGSIVSATTVNEGGTLGGTGQLGAVTVNSGGVYAPGNSIGTQTVNGAFTLGPGAVFEVEANAAGQADKVVVKGSVNLTGSVLRVLAANGNYKPKTDYLIVDNDGGDAVVGKFAAVTSSLAFLTPSVVYNGGDGNDVVLSLERVVTPNGPLSFCSVATTKNQCNVAQALDQFPTDNSLFLAVLNQTADGARQAFDALSGEIHATVPGLLADESRYVREAMLGRLMQATYTNGNGAVGSLSASGPQVSMLSPAPHADENAMALGYKLAGDDKALSSNMPAPSPRIAFWTHGFGAWGDFEGNGNAASADRDLDGFVSGMDAQVSGTWRAGLAVGGSWSNVSVDARHSSADIDSLHLGGYAGGMTGPLAVRAGGAWSFQTVDTSRAVIFPGFFERESTKYDADTGQLFGEIAYPIVRAGLALEPFGGLAFVSVDTDSFREHGGLAALTGSDSDEDVGYSTLGLRAATTFHWGEALIAPRVSAAWQHAFDDVTPDVALAFASTGIGFRITGVPLAEDSLLVEAGLDFALSQSATLGVSYSGQVADEVQDNAVKGRLTWLF